MRAAIVSLHSHSDRSFLDDRELAVLSGDLRHDGLENDLVVAVLDERRGETAGEPNDRVLGRLVETLRAYDVIVLQRLWRLELARELRDRLGGRTFVLCEGEHPVDAPPVDYVCERPTSDSLAALLRWLETRSGDLPAGVAEPRVPGAPQPRRQHGGVARPFAPNLSPVYVNEAALPAFRPFTILGNEGCPYQADARDNPLYAGVSIPDGAGRGCAFCTTGNHYSRTVTAESLGSVLEQLRHLSAHAGSRRHFVLKDQNPFGYLTELVEAAAAEGLRPFTLLLETRADWFLKNDRRFARALAVSRREGYEIAPYLVGIESFSQAELDRFNKGITAERNVTFLETLWQWKREYGDALNLEHASFGFVLFTPWTTLGDLRTNHDAIQRTRFHELRGKILLSRARLYPDNALYHLALRDGLTEPSFASDAEDNAVRFGYLPAQPWRFAHPEVARFSALATELAEEQGGHDEMALFAALLDGFETADRGSVTAGEIRSRVAQAAGRGSASAVPGGPRSDAAHRGEPVRAASPTPGRAMHEWQLGLFRGDALENRVLGRAPSEPAPRPLAEIEQELAAVREPHRVIVTGARPTAHPAFAGAVALARATRAAHVTLETDGGTFASARDLEALAALGIDELFVHAAGMSDGAHAALLRTPGGARECLEGVALACGSGVATYVVVPVARANVKEVLPLVEWLCRLPSRPKGVLLAFPDVAQLGPRDRTLVLPPGAAAELAARVFEKCHSKRVEYGFRSKRGISACAAGGALDRYGTVFHDRQMFWKGGAAEALVRVRACTACSLRDSCHGVERSLVDLFGQADLRPVPLDVSMDWKLRDLNSLGTKDYKNVSPFKNAGGASARGLLRVNGHCNMSCAFCFVDRTAPDFATDGLVAELSRMIDGGARHLVLSGGEPTLHPDLPRLIRHATERGATTVEIQTNGVRSASADYAAELVSAGLTKVTVSLHSADAEHSDKITRLPNAFGKTIAALHNFRRLGVVTQVAHVITKSNYEELPGTMRFLAEEFPATEGHLSVCLAIAQGISDLVYSWVVPRFSEIRPYVKEALDYCLEHDVGFGGMIGQGGYPPCMLDGDLRYYARVYEHLYVSDDWSDQFHKSPKCRDCSFDPHCLGVRRAYVESYGDAELVPFRAPASALPKSAPALLPSPQLVPLRVRRPEPPQP